MTGDVVNLRRARKAKQRAAAADSAAKNRLAFGRSKEARSLDAKQDALAQRRFEAHRCEPAVPPLSVKAKDDD